MEIRKVSAEFILTPDQVERLEKLLPFWKNYEAEDGTHPFEKWTVDELFQNVMLVSSSHVINMQIDAEEWRQTALSVKEETPEAATSRESR